MSIKIGRIEEYGLRHIHYFDAFDAVTVLSELYNRSEAGRLDQVRRDLLPETNQPPGRRRKQNGSSHIRLTYTDP